MHLEWQFNSLLNPIHAAWCFTTAAEVENPLAFGMQDVSSELSELARQMHVPASRFWEAMLTIAPLVDFPDELASRVLSKFGRSAPTDVQRLAAAIRECIAQFAQAFPNYENEIRMRQAPLRSMWEAHGPGLLVEIGRLTEADLLVEQAQIILVQPILAGAGYAHLATNRLHMEAVLTNRFQELPETLRLAWLLSQLDCERPVYSEMINAFRLRSLVGVAMLPACLQAATTLELSSMSPETLLLAMSAWQIQPSSSKAVTLVEVMQVWWETYQASRPEWRTALTALNEMCSELLDE
ncbi:MAG: hypothetical protein KDB22_10595 [Planctomycetales bacterium]|nr:hypothetical protein [Planctomycetales bacterium]